MLDCLEAFYGGAAGGGKSDALLMGGLQYADVPNYAAIIFRRTYADLALPGALMDRAMDWLRGKDCKWDYRDKTWRFPSGATLTFGNMESENDKYRYASSEYQYIGFDELTQFSETQYRFLFSRLRRQKNSIVPLRMRAASNPGGLGHDWVKQRFIVEGRIKNRPFIPAKLEDNPYLDAEEYEKSLKELDPVTREQLRRGDWDVRQEGALFKQEWFEIVDDYAKEARKVRFWDLAATEAKNNSDPDWTAGCGMAYKDGLYYLFDIKRLRATPYNVERLVKQTAELDGRETQIFMEQEPGASGVNTIAHYTQALAGYSFKGIKSSGSKVERARTLVTQAEAGNVKLIKGVWVNEFLDEAGIFPLGSHDDQVDAASGAFLQLVDEPAKLTISANPFY